VSPPSAWAVVGGCALVTAVIKAAGPAASGGRDLPSRFTGVIVLLAPALLAALIVTQALAHGRHFHVGADTAGVAVAGGVLWRGGSVIAGVAVAAAVAAGLRALA
jgi:branched-subunit amino acid transport protein